MLLLTVIYSLSFIGAAVGVFVGCVTLRIAEWTILPRIEPRLSEALPKVTINVK